MIVTSPSTAAFEEFRSANGLYWQQHGRAGGQRDGYVLVDLLHNNATVLLTQILIARYLAELLRADVAAFIAPTFAGNAVPVPEVCALAASFGIREIFHVCPPTPPVPARFAEASNRPSADGQEVRQRVLDIAIDGVPIGDLIYDSYIKLTGAATITDWDELLEGLVAEAEKYFRCIEPILGKDIRALVVSHPCYVDYGIPFRLALKKGIASFCRTWLNPVTIRRYDRFEEIYQFPDTPLAPALKFFRDRLGAELFRRADLLYPPRQKSENDLTYLRYGYGSDKRELSLAELVHKLQIDPKRRTCLIMAHQFSDAPHCYPDSLFDDYFQWLSETLAFVAERSDVNWLVRQHPYEVMIGDNKAFEAVTREYVGNGNVFIAHNSIATSSFFSSVDAITTVNGSAGLEFASAGIPCVLAGNPFYGELSCVQRPRTREHYFQSLADVPRMTRLSPAQVAEAKEAALVHLAYKRVSSTRIPYTTDLAGREISARDIDEFWLEAAQRARNAPLENDPLFVNIRRMMDQDNQTLVDFSVVDDGSASSW